MPLEEKLLLLLVGTLCVLVVIFALAAVLVPEFRTQGAAVAGVIGGLIVAPLSAWIAARFRRNGANGGGT